MSIRIVQLGTARATDEGLRIGTVRRPPRGVPKAEFASHNYYDVWFPNLSPSADLMAKGKAVSTPAEWDSFTRSFKAELNEADASKVLDLLAAMSKTTNFSVGCYCEDESRCHRSILRQLLTERGAEVS
ncbi:MAG: DUF488 family protein [Burkholderiales bacterium]|nr:DUF488 family protein [Burkholderiales bacterium]MBI3729784.1 DUF488 family protein [Burkholderiales bacterium]